MTIRSATARGYTLIELIIAIVLLLALSLLVTVGVVRYLNSVSETQARTALDTTAAAQQTHERRFGAFTNRRADIEALTAGLTMRTSAPAGVADDGTFDTNVVGMYSPDDQGFQTVLLVAQAESGICYFRTLATSRAPAARQMEGSFDVFASSEDGTPECSTGYVLDMLVDDDNAPWPVGTVPTEPEEA